MSKQLFYIEFMTEIKDKDGNKSDYVHRQLVSARFLNHAICLVMEVYNVNRDDVLIARLANTGDFDGDMTRRVMGFDAKYSMLGWWPYARV